MIPVTPNAESRLYVPKMFSMLLLAGPASSRATFWRMKLMPMAEMSGASFGAFRNGL